MLYRIFLTKPYPRVFVITPNGGSATFVGGYDPIARAAEALDKLHAEHRIYAVDNNVVWKPPTPIPPATAFALIDDIKAVLLKRRRAPRLREISDAANAACLRHRSGWRPGLFSSGL